MFHSKKPKSSCGVDHVCKFHLRTDVSCDHDTQCSRVLNTQLPHVIAEQAIHISSSNGWAEFWSEQIRFLFDMVNQVHWLRIKNMVLQLTVTTKKLRKWAGQGKPCEFCVESFVLQIVNVHRFIPTGCEYKEFKDRNRVKNIRPNQYHTTKPAIGIITVTYKSRKGKFVQWQDMSSGGWHWDQFSQTFIPFRRSLFSKTPLSYLEYSFDKFIFALTSGFKKKN